MDQSDDIQVPTPTERDALLAEIRAAFNEVSRKGGTSWSDAYSYDMDRCPADKDDSDHHWTEVAANPKWNATPGIGALP